MTVLQLYKFNHCSIMLSGKTADCAETPPSTPRDEPATPAPSDATDEAPCLNAF